MEVWVNGEAEELIAGWKHSVRKAETRVGFREAKKDLGLEWGGLVFEKMKVSVGR